MTLRVTYNLSKANVYADDTHAKIASNDITELISKTKKELINISEWLRIKKLSANPKKTKFVVIGHQRKINEINKSTTPLHPNLLMAK